MHYRDDASPNSIAASSAEAPQILRRYAISTLAHCRHYSPPFASRYIFRRHYAAATPLLFATPRLISPIFAATPLLIR